jgi:hypothetical protein
MDTEGSLAGAEAREVVGTILPKVLEQSIGMSTRASTGIQSRVEKEVKARPSLQPKPKIRSLTIWSGLLAFFTGLGDFITSMTADDVVQIHRIIVDALVTLGGLGAIVGRIRAKKIVA